MELFLKRGSTLLNFKLNLSFSQEKNIRDRCNWAFDYIRGVSLFFRMYRTVARKRSSARRIKSLSISSCWLYPVRRLEPECNVTVTDLNSSFVSVSVLEEAAGRRKWQRVTVWSIRDTWGQTVIPINSNKVIWSNLQKHWRTDSMRVNEGLTLKITFFLNPSACISILLRLRFSRIMNHIHSTLFQRFLLNRQNASTPSEKLYRKLRIHLWLSIRKFRTSTKRIEATREPTTCH